MASTFKPPATQRIYDVCVVGSQLGGAVAGALLARRGYRVLHVDHDGVGAAYEDGGYLLPYAPAVLPGPRLLPAAELALTELGLATDLVRQLEPCSPDLQILLPRHRVDITHDGARRMQELRREWPHEAERLEAGFARLGRAFDASSPFLKALPPLPPDGFGERRAVGKALRFAGNAPGAEGEDLERVSPLAELEGHPLASSLAIAQRFLGYLDGPTAPFATTRLLGSLLRGTYKLPGSYQHLRELLRRRAEVRGDAATADEATAVAERLEVDGGKVAAVRLAGSPDSWVARVFVAATDAPALQRLLPSEEERSKTARLLETVVTGRQLVCINVVVRTSALPPALGDNALSLRDPDGGDGLENAILLQVLPARRDRGKGVAEAVPDERVICAGGFAPAGLRASDSEAVELLGKKLRDAVLDAVPFYDRHLVHESMPLLAARRTGRGSRLMPHPLYVPVREITLGVTGLPCRSPYKNLLFAGREVVPGLGIEGEFHAGVQAAAAARDLLGRKTG